MKVILSIKPEYVEKIFSGQKRYEFRKGVFKRPIATVVIYATKPVGKVLGEFSVRNVHVDKPDSIWRRTKRHAGIDRVRFDAYFFGRCSAVAIEIQEVFRYERPLDLNDLGDNLSPPQSYCYLPAPETNVQEKLSF